jgi:cold shock CspA family protein
MPQGTIRTYNAQSRSGLILDDTKNELAFDFDSFRESDIREFRLGQRVKFLLEGDAPRVKVRNLTIVSF